MSSKRREELNPVEKLLGQWAQEANGEAYLPDFDPDFSAAFPSLWMLLSWRTVGDYERAPGTLSVAVDGTGWKVSYYDPSAKRRCSVAAATLMDALRKLDGAVTAPDTVWSGGAPRNRSFRKRKTQ